MSFVHALSLKKTIDEINTKTGLEFVYNHNTGEFVSANHWLTYHRGMYHLAYPKGFGKRHLSTPNLDKVIEKINERERS
jgi:hypothetical protein